MLSLRLAAAFGVVLALGTARAAYPPPLVVAHGAVATDHELASRAGLDALKEGGNAVDAACRAALVLGVVSPSSSGIGGGGFLLFYRATDSQVMALDFRERAPARATESLYRTQGKPDPSLAQQGALAVAIPGEVAGLSYAVARYGRLSWRKCVEPAAKLARTGIAASSWLAKVAADTTGLARSPALEALFLPGGVPIAKGARLRQLDLARTLSRIARDPLTFYQGDLAQEIVRAVGQAGGILSAQDLRDYRPKTLTPLEGTYRGHRIVSMPPPSSGGIALLESFNLLERHDLAHLGLGSSALAHLVAEALKHAFADRARYLGDPAFARLPVEKLISKSYAQALDARIHPDLVQPLERYGTAPIALSPRDGGTSHLSIADQDGNLVALTTTINDAFGAKLVAGQTGIVLNNEMDDFSIAEGAANAAGLATSSANRVAPGKTPLSSMSPTIVFDGPIPSIVIGGSGGPLIISSTLEALICVIDFGLDAQTCASAPRVHTQWMPEVLEVESDIPVDVTQALERRGQKIRIMRRTSAVQLLVRSKSGWQASSDPRKGGVPAGY